MTDSTALTVSDALALQNTYNRGGWFGGAGGEMGFFFLFLLIFGYGGFGGGFGWGSRDGGFANQVNNDFLYNGMQRSISDLANNVSRGFDNVNNTLGQGFTQITNQNFGISKELGQYNYNNAMGQAAISREIGDCCCTTNRNIDASRYEMSKGFCDVVNTITANAQNVITNQTAGFQKILDTMCNDRIQQLRDDKNLLQMQLIEVKNNLANTVLADTITNNVNPRSIPTYLTCDPRIPYNYGALFANGYGCNRYCNS